VKHAGEDDARPEAANQLEQGECRGSDAGGAETVNGHMERQVNNWNARFCDENQVDFVFVAREILCQQGEDSFGAAASEVGDEEQDSGPSLRGEGYERLSIRNRKVLLCFASPAIRCSRA